MENQIEVKDMYGHPIKKGDYVENVYKAPVNGSLETGKVLKITPEGKVFFMDMADIFSEPVECDPSVLVVHTPPSGDEWTCADADKMRYGRKVREGVYEFWERGYQEKINLLILSKETKENHISAYGYDSLGELYERWKENLVESPEWLIAECIFEQESGLY